MTKLIKINLVEPKIKGPKKRELYNKLLKMLESHNEEDRDLAREIMIVNFAIIKPEEWQELNDWTWRTNGGQIELEEIQKHYYDKRQEEIRANKRRDSEESE